ncbi:SAM-dependent methyltransferase [Demequina capsici]|uniref:SAM-dependent methyltransferase n=1 Tax=Demequina capsici TaxID=3075620 RepID=A0AA96FFG7_9MICO|nr:SAM-dependent methyltransferase [Demequina sp. PMTSA13]WNM28772.1 SAM-dependent methyltransferase [Demequina sp. PMTSA13]
MTIEMTPLGHVTCTRREQVDDGWDREEATIHLDPAQLGPEALVGIEDFSHVEVIFHFDRHPVDDIETSARRPRGNPEWPRVGILAQRGRRRPNRIGATIARVVAVDGMSLTVTGLDALDGTPVLDIKPYMQEFGPRGPVRQPQWATELMRSYWEA